MVSWRFLRKLRKSPLSRTKSDGFEQEFSRLRSRQLSHGLDQNDPLVNTLDPGIRQPGGVTEVVRSLPVPEPRGLLGMPLAQKESETAHGGSGLFPTSSDERRSGADEPWGQDEGVPRVLQAPAWLNEVDPCYGTPRKRGRRPRRA